VRRAGGAAPAVPAPGDVVYARVTRVGPRQAWLEVLCVGEPPRPAAARYAGVLRQQDVRAAEADTVSLSACFRPGDLVRAAVLSLGDARSYYLTTARDELGVVAARSEAGAPMAPVSWQEMRCPATLAVEPRKVARVGGAVDA
jgi:exosome complex component CSL4